ncbi:MAG TPA: hypothetical protein VN428_02325 [Bryobacteraceae bacterium]|nr:hypothetical protein [Bryobacteraceae bacterium]
MAAKPKLAKQQPLPRIGSLNFSWEMQPDGNAIYTHIPPTPEQLKSGMFKWRPIWCAGYDIDHKGGKHYHHIEGIPCHCPPGPQIRALFSTARETALVGGRNSAKSEATFAFLVRGNIDYDPQNSKPADMSYLNCPEYTFLVLRKNAKDLKNYFERAKRFFSMFGGTATESPMVITFPSGAFGIFDHLDSDDAYEKYQGNEFVRVVLEEAPQIPEERRYLMVTGSCRTTHADMVPQIMLTANPGGRGRRWFNARFWKPLFHADGRPVQLGEVYTEPYSGRTRVLIFSTVDDNPYALSKGADKDLDLYRATDPVLYRQWRLGDMEAVKGQYFDAFRERLLLDASGKPVESENARHVIKPIRLAPHWPRAIGVDWGYSHQSAILWGCWHPKGQLHIYREYGVSRVGTVQLGSEIASKSIEELEQMSDPHLVMYLSHDAFHRTDDTSTEAEQIKQGVERVLGKDAAFVLSLTQEEAFLENKVAWESVRRRQREQARKTHITIVNAGLNRKGGWNLIRELLRWWPLEGPQAKFSEEVSRKILMEQGALAWYEYKQACEKRAEEVLPKILFHDCCTKVITGVQAAVESETDSEDVQKQDGDDFVDSLNYLCRNFTFREAQQTRDMIVTDKLQQIREREPGITIPSLIRAAELNESGWFGAGAAATTACISRSAGPSRRRAWQPGRVN